MARQSVYRKLWEEHYGEIPKESNGRSYDIHHINGDHYDNRIENLMAVTRSEHANLHAQEKLLDGTHNFLDSEQQRRTANQKVVDNTHPFLGGEVQRKRVEDGTHNFLGGDIQRTANKRRLEEGTHPFLNPSGRCHRMVISMDDQKVTTSHAKHWHEKKTGYKHIWVDL